MKFSVVMPVYNAAPYLATSLNSLRAQKHIDWEAICVDDGSTDGSAQILDDFARRDVRIQVVHQANAGSSVARNAALRRVSGDYVCFLDSDDVLAPSWLSHAEEILSVHPVDLLRFGWTPWTDGTPLPAVENETAPTVFYETPDAACSWGWKAFLRHGQSWRHVIRRAVLDGLDYPVGLIMKEDNVFMVQVASRLSSAADCAYGGYFYRQLATSISNRCHTVATQQAFRRGLKAAWRVHHARVKKLPDYRELRRLYHFYLYLRFVPDAVWTPGGFVRRVCDSVRIRFWRLIEGPP